MKIDWEKVKEVAGKYEEQIFSLPGVVGISTGVRRESGEPCIRVYLSSPVERGNLEDEKIPYELEGIPVDAVVTGEFRALDD